MHIVNKGTPTYIKVTGNGTAFGAFFADHKPGFCGDNSGGATLRIQEIQSIPLICKGINCN
jgi:hypothetical protein